MSIKKTHGVVRVHQFECIMKIAILLTGRERGVEIVNIA